MSHLVQIFAMASTLVGHGHEATLLEEDSLTFLGTDKNRHVCKGLQAWNSSGKISRHYGVGHGSVPCRPLFYLILCFQLFLFCQKTLIKVLQTSNPPPYFLYGAYTPIPRYCFHIQDVHILNSKLKSMFSFHKAYIATCPSIPY